VGSDWLSENWVALLVMVVAFSIIGPIAMRRFGQIVKSKEDKDAGKGTL